MGRSTGTIRNKSHYGRTNTSFLIFAIIFRIGTRLVALYYKSIFCTSSTSSTWFAPFSSWLASILVLRFFPVLTSTSLWWWCTSFLLFFSLDFLGWHILSSHDYVDWILQNGTQVLSPYFCSAARFRKNVVHLSNLFVMNSLSIEIHINILLPYKSFSFCRIGTSLRFDTDLIRGSHLKVPLKDLVDYPIARTFRMI